MKRKREKKRVHFLEEQTGKATSSEKWQRKKQRGDRRNRKNSRVEIEAQIESI